MCVCVCVFMYVLARFEMQAGYNWKTILSKRTYYHGTIQFEVKLDQYDTTNSCKLTTTWITLWSFTLPISRSCVAVTVNVVLGVVPSSFPHDSGFETLKVRACVGCSLNVTRTVG